MVSTRRLLQVVGVILAGFVLANGAGAQAPSAQTPAPVQPTPLPDLQKSDSYLPFIYGPLDPAGMVASLAPNGAKTHILPATPATTQWGWFDSNQAPVLKVNSGDTIVMETMTASHNQIVPGVTMDQLVKMRNDFPGRGPHTVTGPIYVEGADPGDILRIKFNKIVPRPYASNMNLPGILGAFPKEFPQGQIKYFYPCLSGCHTHPLPVVC